MTREKLYETCFEVKSVDKYVFLEGMQPEKSSYWF